MSDKIFQIVHNVNDYLHNGHGRGIFDPERMAASRTSNCFGRLAIVGSVLSDELPDVSTFLLIARNHGMPFESTSGRSARWFAHAEAVIIEDQASYLLDTPPFTNEANPSLQNISHTTWITEPPSSIVYHPERDVALRVEDLPEPELLRRYGPPVIRACHHIFDVYPFEEGLEVYQRGTGGIDRQIYTKQDYRQFYYSTILPDRAAAIIASEPAASA